MNVNSFLNKLAGASGLCLLTVCLLSACGQSGQKPQPKQQSAQQQQQEEKEPKKLKDIEKSIEDLMTELENPSAPKQEAQGQQQGQGQGQQQGQSQGQGQQQSQGQGQQQPQTKDSWKGVSSIVDNLHFQWNEFMPEAVKKGSSLKFTENFSNSLNNLTTTITTKDKNKTLVAANSLYGSIADLYSLYRTKMSPEIKRMHYLLKNTILTSDASDWTQAEKDMNGLKASWAISRGSLGKEQEKDQSKIDMSLTELEKVVKEKNLQLTAIKGKVAMSNIKALEKSYEK